MFGIFIVYYDISIPTITRILYIQKIDYIWKKFLVTFLSIHNLTTLLEKNNLDE
jgi:hypothetical protein